MISTKHDLNIVKIKKYGNTEIDEPEIMPYLNQANQGIDLSDKIASYFSPLWKVIRWYHKIAFELLLSTSVMNFLQIYRDVQKMHLRIAMFRPSIT